MRMCVAIASALASAMILPLTATSAEAASPIRITYAQYDSPGDDTGSNKSVNAEWIRIKNFSRTKKSLSGWTLRDPRGHVYRFGAYTLGAGKSVVVHTGSASNTAAHRYWRQNYYVWNNTGDKAVLKNQAGTTVDACKWGDGDGNTAC